MDPTTAAAGVAAMLLRPAPAEPVPETGREALRSLRVALDTPPAEALDAWRRGGAVDGEQVLCAADLLARRARSDLHFGEILVAAADDDAALRSLVDLAGSFQLRGQWGAAAWCAERYADLRSALPAATGARSSLPAPTLAQSWPGDLAAHGALVELARLLDSGAPLPGDQEAEPVPDPAATMVAATERVDAMASPVRQRTA
jgi:hypothetical protein